MHESMLNQIITLAVASCSLRGFCQIRRPYNPNFRPGLRW